MRQVQVQITEIFTRAIVRLVGETGSVALVTRASPKYGDYQCNSAMGLMKEHGKSLGVRSPKECAEKIMGALLPEEAAVFSDVVIAPQGFITVKLSEQFLEEAVHEVFGAAQPGVGLGRRVVVDYSSPNVAKEMHVGHLRSTIIGESICRILESENFDIVRLNHVGDWGTQFGMLIEYLKEQKASSDATANISDLQNFYRAAKQRFDESAEFKKRAQLSVVALQGGDAKAREAWKGICAVSREAFNAIYSRLGVDERLIERGESFYNEMIPEIVQELRKTGVVVESEGAQCIFCPKVDQVPLMVVKSDGGYGYDSTDMAAVKHRIVDEKADWLIYVTDLGQETHFLKIFEAAKMAGWAGVVRMDHVGFGVVQGEDGKKFKTRSGDVVRLADLLDEAEERALKELEGRADLEGEEVKKQAAKVIGVAAVKYFDLKQNRGTNYSFSYDKMLDPKGNTAVYLLYAYARICAILRKAGDAADVAPAVSGTEIKITHEKERLLVLELLKYPDVIGNILEDLHIHRLPEFMWDVANRFSQFYTECRVVGSEQERSRLLLVEATRRILKKSFNLLGIQPLERM